MVNESGKMIIGITKENLRFETRVSMVPNVAAKLIKAGFEIKMEQNAGLKSCFRNSEYAAAGVNVVATAADVLKSCDIWLKVNAPEQNDVKLLKNRSIIVGNMQNHHLSKLRDYMEAHEIRCLALNLLPRLSRAQGFDILSSQNNLAGYQAVFKAAQFLPATLPLMITSAGTLAPAKVLVIGVGVAGLQAIATAKRLGAKVYAYDINYEVREQAESVGAKFVQDFRGLLDDVNVIITAVAGSKAPAPLIITTDILERLPNHCVLIDLAAAQGGNIEKSENMKITRCQNCIIYGDGNLAREIPYSASMLLANNFYNFVMYIYDQEKQQLKLDNNDEIIQAIKLKE